MKKIKRSRVFLRDLAAFTEPQEGQGPTLNIKGMTPAFRRTKTSGAGGFGCLSIAESARGALTYRHIKARTTPLDRLPEITQPLQTKRVIVVTFGIYGSSRR